MPPPAHTPVALTETPTLSPLCPPLKRKKGILSAPLSVSAAVTFPNTHWAGLTCWLLRLESTAEVCKLASCTCHHRLSASWLCPHVAGTAEQGATLLRCPPLSAVGRGGSVLHHLSCGGPAVRTNSLRALCGINMSLGSRWICGGEGKPHFDKGLN